MVERTSPVTETDIVQRLRNFCVWNNRHSHYDPVPVCQEAADEIVRLRGHAQCSNEPTAYLHTLHMELGQTQRKLMWTEPSPFGLPGKHYDATYTVSCTPLFAVTDTSTAGNSKPICQNCGDPITDAVHAAGFCGTCREMGCSDTSTDRPAGNLYKWPVGCLHPGSCNRHGECMYISCTHAGKKIETHADTSPDRPKDQPGCKHHSIKATGA